MIFYFNFFLSSFKIASYTIPSIQKNLFIAVISGYHTFVNGGIIFVNSLLELIYEE
jgi:hypothetical protein